MKRSATRKTVDEEPHKYQKKRKIKNPKDAKLESGPRRSSSNYLYPPVEAQTRAPLSNRI